MSAKPQFSESVRKEIDTLVGRYPTKRAALLPVLWVAQREFRTISDEVIELVGRTLGLSPAYVYGVVTFYTMYYRQPAGRHHLEVCANLSCCLMGAPRLVDHLERRLGIKAGETTPDGAITLSTVECLASCGSGPMLCLDRKEYVENLTEAKLDALLERLKK